MDYKEKYEMALEGLQEILSSGEDSIKMSRLQLRLQGIFPELAESDDERIRKEIIAILQYKYENFSKDPKYHNVPQWIAWLEKQGQTFTKKDVDDAYLKGVCDTKHELEKQGEQKSAWSEEDSYMLGQAIKCVNNSGKLDVSTEEIEYWLKSIGPQKKWKPSEDQMTALAEALSLAKNCGEDWSFDLRTLHEQLKKLKGE